jgi:hypothetical protein
LQQDVPKRLRLTQGAKNMSHCEYGNQLRKTNVIDTSVKCPGF